jgi:hypothetical protein
MSICTLWYGKIVKKMEIFQLGCQHKKVIRLSYYWAIYEGYNSEHGGDIDVCKECGKIIRSHYPTAREDIIFGLNMEDL